MPLRRTHILLEDRQYAQLTAMARERRATLSELVRQMVEKGLAEAMGPPKRLLAMRGIMGDGTWDPADLDREVYRVDE